MTKLSFRFLFCLLIVTFFTWGFLTPLNDVLIAPLKAIYQLSYFQVMFVQFSFFGAYGLLSIPASKFVHARGYKRGVNLGLYICLVGCLFFVVATAVSRFEVFLLSLFVVASGVVLLQVSAYPWLALIGNPQNSSQRLTFAEGFNAVGSVLAPLVGSFFILTTHVKTEAEMALMGEEALRCYQKTLEKSMGIPYLVIGALIVVLLFCLRMGNIRDIYDNRKKPFGSSKLKKLSFSKHRHLFLGCFAIFFYVGAEVSLGSFLINFMKQSTVLGFSSAKAGSFLAFYWGGTLVGRFVYSLFLGKYRSRYLLGINVTLAALFTLLGIVTEGYFAVGSFLVIGLFNAMMFPTIFDLAIKELKDLTPLGSGLLCTSITGGALIPLLMGALADWIGIQHAFIIPFFCYSYVLYYCTEGYRRRRVRKGIYDPSEKCVSY